MSSVTKPILKNETFSAKMDALIAKFGTLSTFTGLKAALDAGLGRHIPLGTEVSYTDTEFGTMTYKCVDFDNETETMTLLMKDTLATAMQFDAPEATYYCSEALPVGNYTFKIYNTSYYFALTQEAPQGAQLRLLTNEFTVYTTHGGVIIGETGSVSTTALESPTDLGTTGTGVLNHYIRVQCGSNDYGESAIRQYLNASGYNWWLPKTGFDRPPDYAGRKGFMTGIPAEVLAVIDTTEVLCASQNTYCAPDSAHAKDSRYICNDKFFLASQMEIFGSSAFTDNSTLFDLFVGASNADRIKRYGSSARNWWLRSPYSNAYTERNVNTSGAVYDNGAYDSRGVVAACKISKSTKVA